MPREITPQMLDWAANGFPVFINRNKHGQLYATVHEIEPEAIVRVPVTDLLKDADPCKHAMVAAKIAELQGKPESLGKKL